MYESFVTKARALGTEVYRVDDPASAGQLIERLLREAGAKKVALAPAPLLDALDMKKVVSAAGAELLTAGTVRQRAGEADLGITAFDLAIAETGTLVQDAAALDRRLISMLPPVHLAVVPAYRLVATFRQAVEALAAGEIPGYLAFVSGPSRTADIERVLTIGVHGPGRLIVIFIDEKEGRGSR